MGVPQLPNMKTGKMCSYCTLHFPLFNTIVSTAVVAVLSLQSIPRLKTAC